MTRPVYKFKHLDRLNSPNSVQFIRLLQKSQVSKSLKRLIFQNLTKPSVCKGFVTILLTNNVFSSTFPALTSTTGVRKCANSSVAVVTAKVVPNLPHTLRPKYIVSCAKVTSTCGKLAAQRGSRNNEKTELKLPVPQCLYCTFALRFDITLSRRKLKNR